MKTVVLFITIMLCTFTGNAQSINEQTLNAFSASYTAEQVKDYDKAVSALKNVYNEEGYEVNLRLGWLTYLKKDYEQSERYYKQALKVKPNSVEAMFGFINPAAALQKWNEVFDTYQKILKLDPDNSIANYRIALMYYYRKEFANAEKHLETVTAHYPFDYDSLLLLAQVELATGKLAESKSYYQRALLYNPSNEEIKKILSKL